LNPRLWFIPSFKSGLLSLRSMSTAASKKKGPNYTHDEVTTLAKAWLNIYLKTPRWASIKLSPLFGTELQPSTRSTLLLPLKGMRVALLSRSIRSDSFLNCRTAVSLETKWGDLQTQVNKFAACFIQVSTNPPSGTTLDDLIKVLQYYGDVCRGGCLMCAGLFVIRWPWSFTLPSKKRSRSPGKLNSMKVEMDPTPSSTAVSSSSSADSQAADCKLFVEENKSGMKEVILLKRVSVSFSEDTCCCRDPWVPKRPKSCKPWQTHALRATKS